MWGWGAQATHGLGLVADALAADVVQAVGFDEGERNVTVEDGIVGEVDALLAALPEKLLHGVAPAGE